MTPRIATLNERKIVGMRLTMSFADYRIAELWRSFLPKRKEITNNCTNDLISLVVYKSNHFIDFSPTSQFERWAAVEVVDFERIPIGMESYILQTDFMQFLTIKV
jgi:AraC family transcriptional regulator